MGNGAAFLHNIPHWFGTSDMVVRRQLDRKARAWLTAAIVLLIAAPVLGIRSCVATQLDNDRIVVSASVDDRLISLKDGSTMLLEHGSTARKVADWLRVGTTTEHRFALGDESFAPGSVEPTPEGSAHLIQFAQVMKAHPELTTHIWVTQARGAESQSENRLEQSRARRLRDDIIAQGVSATKITAADQPVEVQSKEAGGHPRLLIVLERATA